MGFDNFCTSTDNSQFFESRIYRRNITTSQKAVVVPRAIIAFHFSRGSHCEFQHDVVGPTDFGKIRAADPIISHKSLYTLYDNLAFRVLALFLRWFSRCLIGRDLWTQNRTSMSIAEKAEDVITWKLDVWGGCAVVLLFCCPVVGGCSVLSWLVTPI